MHIEVQRFVSDNDTTISKVYVDGQFVCFGLEDEYRAVKLVHETRIPAGNYQVRLRCEGEHHIKYQQRFGAMHRGMLHIQNVPGFEYILIHCGNTQADTSGCLLVGSGAITEKGNMSISGSGAAYVKLYGMVVSAAADKVLDITFVDGDR
ncbi:DUF5675 family protein [Chitinimonas sp.]|uniref:DUF5675 family protein n=1 Tax=Chitinimonas sp. TaxID=1934313 RepID=UPI002F95C429